MIWHFSQSDGFFSHLLTLFTAVVLYSSSLTLTQQSHTRCSPTKVNKFCMWLWVRSSSSFSVDVLCNFVLCVCFFFALFLFWQTENTLIFFYFLTEITQSIDTVSSDLVLLFSIKFYWISGFNELFCYVFFSVWISTITLNQYGVVSFVSFLFLYLNIRERDCYASSKKKVPNMNVIHI